MGLLDAAQAASNAAASTVSGPVDMLAWLLRKAGVNVGEPVGGSDWMKRKGLTKDVAPGASQVVGETLGLLAPTVAAAKAPQIAKGLLAAADNLAAPRTLNPQQGAIVWHGSPHKFDRFDSSKIGTGEGAQAYGHGIYFAEAPEVAMSYQPRDMGFESALMKKSELAQRTSNYPAAQVYEDFLLHKTPKEVEQLIAEAGYTGGDLARARAALEFSKKQYFNQRSGALYKVDLPDNAIARMLDWDSSIKGQPVNVQPLVEKIKALPVLNRDSFGEAGHLFRSERDLLDSGQMKGADLYNIFRREFGGENMSGASASELLRQNGVPGIRYLDGNSRGAGTGTRNFVVLPGEEGLLNILERNGVPLSR